MEGVRRIRRWVRGTGLVTGLAALIAAYAVVQAPAGGTSVAPAMVPAAETSLLRQTESAAVAHARKAGAQVEIGAYRSETRSVFANPDGTITSRDYAQPVRVLRDGSWVTPDATLTTEPDGTLAPKAAAYGLRLSGGGDGPLLTAERAGRSISLNWPGNLPRPTMAGDRATYAEVLPGVDLVVNVGVTDFSHVVVVKTAEAARDSRLASLRFGLRTDGLDVRNSTSGGLSAVDVAAGGAVFEAVTPIMWDSGVAALTATQKAQARSVDPRPQAAVEAAPATAAVVPIGVSVTPDALTLTPDKAMLADPDTRFPVYIDPLWTDTRASGWAMVSSGFDNEEYWKFKDDEGLGRCPVTSGTCNNTDVKRLYYALPTNFAGKTIIKAELAVTMTHTYNSSAQEVSAYRAKSGIGSGTNWNNKPALGTKQDTKAPTATAGGCTATNQNVRFDVRNAVTQAASSGSTTTTFVLKSDDESASASWKRFCGNAILEVTYNRAPNTPLQKNLRSNPGGECIYGSGRPYGNVAPTLSAILSDPDRTGSNSEQLTAEFKIYWTPAGGSTVTKTYRTGRKASGNTFTLNTATAKDLNLPANTVIAWEVRANDGTANGQWSSYADQTRCEFIIDLTSPASPDIDSAEYLPLDDPEKTGQCEPDEVPAPNEEDGPSPSWRGWIGKYGTFVFDSAATDVVEYRYGFDTNPLAANLLKPTSNGGPVSVTWAPLEDGPHTINVQAKDRAGRSSAIASCTFYVATRLSTGSWSLDDTGPEAADGRNTNPAIAGAGVTFGVPGPACPESVAGCTTDRAVRLTGGADSYLATAGAAPVVDTGAAFAVSAWVRLTDDTGDRVAVSQDGTGEAGFWLGLNGATKKWTFTAPAGPVDSLGDWTSSSTAVAVKDTWTHLAGVHDPVRKTIQLFVNGVPQPAAAKRTSWRSFGRLQFGRRLDQFGYLGSWAGNLADVNVFDRIIVPREAEALAHRRPQRTAYWPLDEATTTQSEPYNDPSGPELHLAGGAAVVAPDPETATPAERPLMGGGDLRLDGVDDHADTLGPAAKTNGSYAISARVRLAAGSCTRTMAVVAQAGVRESGFALRCSAANTWQAVLPQLDGTDPGKPAAVLTGAGTPSPDQSGQALILVYDAFLHQATLYVNGEATGTASGNFAANWTAGGPLTIGRAMRSGSYGDYFAGVVDDVRVYTGFVDTDTVSRLATLTADPDL
jgi:hypothetical protein